MKIDEYIIKILQKKTKTKITKNTKISTLKIDSLDLVEVVIDAEEKFGVVVPDDKLEGLKDKTIAEILELFHKTKK